MLKNSFLLLMIFLGALKEDMSGEMPQFDYQILEGQLGSCLDGGDSLRILLPNGLRVFLLSNPNLKESSGAMSVEAGAWDDPPQYPGMAHFVEHLLFLGTEAYPEESEYKKYIEERGGEFNATTSRDKSIYGFTVDTLALEGSLDRFSHFFIDPLFTRSSIEKEKHSVHHEFEDSLENEFSRIWRVFKDTGNPHHANANFSFGNIHSLEGIQREDIFNWFHKYYQPQHMCLVLVSPLPLDQLTQYASDFFSRIPKGNVPFEKNRHKGSMSSSLQRGSLIHIDSVFNARILSLFWELPKEFMEPEKCQVFPLIEMALNHGYINSLARVLEEEGVATTMQASFWKVQKEHGIFRMDVSLTPKGVKNYRLVVERCFQVLKLLRESSIPRHLFDRLEGKKKVCVLLSNYQRAMHIAEKILDEETMGYPVEDSLSFEDASCHIGSLLSALTPHNALYFFVAPAEETGMIPSHLEKWMGTKYLVRKIPQEEKLIWESTDIHPEIGFQPKEKAPPIKTSCSSFESDFKKKDLVMPVFIVDDSLAKIRLLDSCIEEDRIESFFCIGTPFLNSSIRGVALNEMLVSVLEEKLLKEFSSEEGFSWKLTMEKSRLCISLEAPKAQSKTYFEQFFQIIKQSRVNKEEFERIKQLKLRNYGGDPSPLEYAQQFLDSFVFSFEYTPMELYQVLLELNYEEYNDFQEKSFKEAFIEGAFLGSLGEKQAVDLWASIYGKLGFLEYREYYGAARRAIFSDEGLLLHQKTHRKGNAMLLLVASKDSGKASLAQHQLIAGALQSEFFQELRTQQQTAYRLYNWSAWIDECLCHGFVLQSTTHAPLDLLNRVDYFLNEFAEDILNRISKERFEVIRDTLILRCQKQKEDKKEGRREMDQNILGLKKLKYEDVISSAEKMFSLENRKRIAVLIEGCDFNDKRSDYKEFMYNLVPKDFFNQF